MPGKTTIGQAELTCAHCGVKFFDHASQGRKYHSNECKAAARRRKETRICKGCEVAFEIHPSRSNVYHSPECYRETISRSASRRATARIIESTSQRQARATQAEDRRILADPEALPPDVDGRSYLMGVFDGEGCITGGYDRRDGRFFLVVTVCMASEAIVRTFVATWGGTFGPRSRLTIGGLTLWDWRISSGRAVPFLTYAAEHSITKRAQARIALDLAANMAKYASAREAGFNPRKHGRVLTQADHELRQRLVSEIRAMNGARSRFKDQARLRLPG